MKPAAAVQMPADTLRRVADGSSNVIGPNHAQQSNDMHCFSSRLCFRVKPQIESFFEDIGFDSVREKDKMRYVHREVKLRNLIEVRQV